MLSLYIFLYVCSFSCFAAHTYGVPAKVNLLALGLALFTMVPLLQVLQRAF